MHNLSSMHNFNIVTDSSADLMLNYYKEIDVQVMPMHYIIEDKEYIDGLDDENHSEFFSQMKNGAIAKTVQVSVDNYLTYWETIYQQGPIIQIALGSSLSGTYSSGVVAAKEFQSMHPDAVIYVIDSLGASVGQGQLCKYASDLRNEGKDAKTVFELVQSSIKHNNIWFTVDDLIYLKRGGRLSSASAFFGSLLSIKPILAVGKDGSLLAAEKQKGRKKALRRLIEIFQEKRINQFGNDVFIGHSACPNDAEEFKNMLLDTDPSLNIKVSQIGPIIGSHTGPGLIVFSFFGSPRDLEK